MSQNGKGDKSRPLSIDKKQFNKNWQKTFSKKKEKKDEQMHSQTEKCGSCDNSRD